MTSRQPSTRLRWWGLLLAVFAAVMGVPGGQWIDGAEFRGITTRSQFASHIEDVVSNGIMRPLERGWTAYWQNGTVVIRNPNAVDGGTAFRPKNGYDYFLGLE